jgi:hypothetical protein
LKRILAAARQPRSAGGNIQLLLLFFTGIGFIALGMNRYPACIGVGVMFWVITYRGMTGNRGRFQDRE